jgi:uncharacterized RDD family membrane protein YckC
MGSVIYCNRCGLQSDADADFCQSCGAALRTTTPELAPVHAFPRESREAPGHTVRYGGFWIRVCASLFDWILVFLAFFPVRILVGSTVTVLGEAWEAPAARSMFIGRMVRIGFAIAASWLYRAGMESSHFQGTLGKLVMQIKVTDLHGNRISFEHATGRYLAKFLSAITLGIGYLMVGFTAKKQGLHDQLAGTLVQHR